MPLIHSIELHKRRDNYKFNYLLSALLFSFFFSYVLYLFLPAVGPRFTLHESSNLSLELPGILLTDLFREVINYGGGIINSKTNPIELVNRDCMPSGHTWITIVNIFLAFKFKSKFRWMFLFFGTGLIISTVYLRYHYVVDIIAGIILAAFTLYLQSKLFKIYYKNRSNYLEQITTFEN